MIVLVLYLMRVVKWWILCVLFDLMIMFVFVCRFWWIKCWCSVLIVKSGGIGVNFLFIVLLDKINRDIFCLIVFFVCWNRFFRFFLRLLENSVWMFWFLILGCISVFSVLNCLFDNIGVYSFMWCVFFLFGCSRLFLVFS